MNVVREFIANMLGGNTRDMMHLTAQVIHVGFLCYAFYPSIIDHRFVRWRYHALKSRRRILLAPIHVYMLIIQMIGKGPRAMSPPGHANMPL